MTGVQEFVYLVGAGTITVVVFLAAAGAFYWAGSRLYEWWRWGWPCELRDVLGSCKILERLEAEGSADELSRFHDICLRHLGYWSDSRSRWWRYHTIRHARIARDASYRIRPAPPASVEEFERGTSLQSV